MDYINYSYVSLANILCYRYISLKLESWNNSRKIQVTWKPSLWPTFISWLPVSILGDPCQRQIVGARESLNGRENMARRKEKNGEKSPWGQCVTRPVPNCRGRSGFWLVPENVCVFLPNQKAERRPPFGTGLVRHCFQGLFSPFFSFLRATFPRPFRLSLTSTICPWVSENVRFLELWERGDMSIKLMLRGKIA